MIPAAVFTTGLALAFAAVLALVLFSGRLSATARRWVERALCVALVAACATSFGWSLAKAFRENDWRLSLAAQPILWAWMGMAIVLQRRRKARAKDRQPGTFG